MNKVLYLLMVLIAMFACNDARNNGAENKNITNATNDSIFNRSIHDTMDIAFAKQQLQDLLDGKGQPFTWDTLIKNSNTAIAMAEPLLFEIFGKEQILSEKPYEVYLINGYWYISGTIPKGWKGGGFEIIMSAKNGEIVRLTHYK